jgi:hypothetical protein
LSALEKFVNLRIEFPLFFDAGQTDEVQFIRICGQSERSSSVHGFIDVVFDVIEPARAAIGRALPTP